MYSRDEGAETRILELFFLRKLITLLVLMSVPISVLIPIPVPTKLYKEVAAVQAGDWVLAGVGCDWFSAILTAFQPMVTQST